MLLLIGGARAIRACDACRRRGGLCATFGVGPFMAYMANEHVPPVREWIPVRHPALHPDGRARRAGGNCAAALFRHARMFRRFRWLRHGCHRGLTAFWRDLRILGLLATTATFGRAALPELQRYKYDLGFATGTIAVGGQGRVLIPPSVILVVDAITTEQNTSAKSLPDAVLIPGSWPHSSTAS